MVYLDSVQMQEHLPQRYPFLFIDAIKSYDPEVPAIVAIKNVSNSDPILQGHFPGNPILPGVVMIESMAQAAVVLGSLKGLYDPDNQNCYFLKIDEAKFRKASVPGESLDVYVKALRVGRVGKFACEIKLGDEVKCTATLTAGFFPKEGPPLG